ncbi:hypothetical protein OM416_27750 [Paenibacillus sp. LS1]|uniref:hypothetical protein n=1 Tax=Paenibacillus sp. LS1 TaxID=2992120 RepID=UPI00222F1DCF|nr:hypothetical protein [Paenibacillus sp. LS1]MCW3795406.1 hypothetical protein [Paenibacillus sp. LS1]MCW3795407.1 hypothetical protein [Paenibacillus sp. LS1]
MATSREYATSVIVTRQELSKMILAQRTVLESGRFKTGVADKAAILAGLGGIGATVLGLIFVASAPVSIAAGVAGLSLSLFGIGAGGKMEDLLEYGIKGMTEILTDINAYGSRYSQYQLKFPFLEYTLQDGTVLRFVQGKGVVERARSGSGWEIIN